MRCSWVPTEIEWSKWDILKIVRTEVNYLRCILIESFISIEIDLFHGDVTCAKLFIL